MKKLIATVMIFCMLMPLCCSCAVTSSAVIAVENYMKLIADADYSAAYDMLASAVKNEGEEAKEGTIKREDFIKRYTDIFEALKITLVTYDSVNIKDGEVLTTASYNATYHSEYIGDSTYSFKLESVCEGSTWRIQWSPALIFPDMQWGDTVRVAKISADRGEIMASGSALAATRGKLTVFISPSKLEDAGLAVERVAGLLGVERDKIQKNIDKAYNDFALVGQYYSDEISETVRAQLLDIDGVGIDEGNYGTQREYPFGSLLAHTIGYVGPVSAATDEALLEEIDRLNGLAGSDSAYNSDSIVGKLGLESKYETELRGSDGTQIYIMTAEGTNRRTLYLDPAKDGLDIHLTIDLELQERLEEVMRLVLYGDTTAGAVVVLDPTTGKVQAMASYPTYDLNLFTRGISAQDYNDLIENPAKPLINRVTQGLYPPGSVFKAFTAAAALENGVLDTSYVFNKKIEQDYWTPDEYGDWIWTPIKRTTMRNRTEPLNMHNAILNSDNIYFAYAALQLGEERLMEFMTKLGFTEELPFDINVADAQLINDETDMSLKLVADSGYGQGEILTTPLQLAAAFSTYANGGDICVPHIVDKLYEVDGIRYNEVWASQRELWKTDVISDSSIDTILPMLKDVVRSDLNGTGRRLKVTSCTVAAKTGTAEIGDDKSREISWFAGFRTGVEPEDERLVVVMLEIATSDSDLSTLKFDIARELLKLS